MFQIQFLDVNGKEINPGDWLKVRCHSFGTRYSTFYVQFQVKDDHIVPHDTFAWESLELIKFEDIPQDICSNDEGGYYYQYENENGEDSGHRSHFLISLGEITSRTKSFVIKPLAPIQ
jgi:hypothetical protein